MTTTTLDAINSTADHTLIESPILDEEDEKKKEKAEELSRIISEPFLYKAAASKSREITVEIKGDRDKITGALKGTATSQDGNKTIEGSVGAGNDGAIFGGVSGKIRF